jgi:hypothetical protein
VAQRWLISPRKREVELARRPSDDVPDGEPPSCSKHTAGLVVQAGLAGHVHLNVLAEDDGETG